MRPYYGSVYVVRFAGSLWRYSHQHGRRRDYYECGGWHNQRGSRNNYQWRGGYYYCSRNDY